MTKSVGCMRRRTFLKAAAGSVVGPMIVPASVLGKVLRVEVGLPPSYDHVMGDSTPQTPPEHLDYDLWCGPSVKLPYIPARHHRFWRGHTAYGGGTLMDWIGHHNDIVHWGLDMDTGAVPSIWSFVGWTRWIWGPDGVGAPEFRRALRGLVFLVRRSWGFHRCGVAMQGACLWREGKFGATFRWGHEYRVGRSAWLGE